MQVKEAIRYGLITLGTLFYLNVLGLPLTLGGNAIPLFVAAVALIAFAFLRRDGGEDSRSPAATIVSGALIGLITGAGLAAVTALFARFHATGVQINRVFAQVLPDHTAALTGLTKAEVIAGESVAGPLMQLALYLTLGGVVGGVLALLGRRERDPDSRPFTATRIGHLLILTLPLLFFASFFALRLDGVQVAGNSENIVGLVIIFFFVASGLVALRRAEAGREKLVVGIVLLVMAVIIPFYADLFQNAVLGKIAIFISVGLGLNIVIGYAGMLHLGYVAFFAVGAYAFGLLASPSGYIATTFPALAGISFWVGLPLAIIAGIVVGILLGLPVLRTRGDYLAIVTLGFAEIIRLLFLNLRDYTGGPGGVLNIPPPIVFGVRLGSPQNILFLGMLLAAIVVFISVRLKDSRLGRSWLAMREDEDVAQTMGINLASTKLLAFAIGAAFAGAAGALYASRQVNIFPDNFDLLVAIDILSLIIIGGLGSIEGVVLGAMALVGLPEVLRGVDEYRIVAFGALLVVMMITRPEGLLPSARRQRELHAEEQDQDAWLKMAQEAAQKQQEEATGSAT